MIDIKKSRNIFSKRSASKLDGRIFKLLKNNTSPENIFREIKNNSDTEGVSRFLFNSGLHNTLFLYNLKLLKEKQEVSWHYVIKILIKYKIYPAEKELIEALFHTWLKKSRYFALFSCEEWGQASPEFEQMKNVFIEELETANISEEKELLNQLAFIQAQEMIEDEEEIIQQLIRLNPANQEYRSLKKELDEKKAFLIIQEHKKSQDSSKLIKKSQLKSQEQTLKKSWLEGLVEMGQIDPSCIKELALFLYFCGSPKTALDLLESYIDKLEDYWYYLDWSLETGQFSKGLAVVNYIERSKDFYHFDSVELLYKKAQFLYGLGREKQAIEHLRSISQFYPDYKNINYLLNKWAKSV